MSGCILRAYHRPVQKRSLRSTNPLHGQLLTNSPQTVAHKLVDCGPLVRGVKGTEHIRKASGQDGERADEGGVARQGPRKLDQHSETNDVYIFSFLSAAAANAASHLSHKLPTLFENRNILEPLPNGAFLHWKKNTNN